MKQNSPTLCTMTNHEPKTQDKKRPSMPSRREVLERGMARIACDGWDLFSIDILARDLKISPATLARFCTDKAGFLRLVGDETDAAMETYEPTDGSTRDKLFDIIMYRFDLLEPWREGIVAVLENWKRHDPLLPLALLPVFHCSMAKILVKAGMDPSPACVPVIGFAYGRAMQAWAKDSSPDRGKTMKMLNEKLAQIEHIADTFFPFRR